MKSKLFKKRKTELYCLLLPLFVSRIINYKFLLLFMLHYYLFDGIIEVRVIDSLYPLLLVTVIV